MELTLSYTANIPRIQMIHYSNCLMCSGWPVW